MKKLLLLTMPLVIAVFCTAVSEKLVKVNSENCDGPEDEFEIFITVTASEDGEYNVSLDEKKGVFDFVYPKTGSDSYPMFANDSIEFNFTLRANESVKNGDHIVRYTVTKDSALLERGEVEISVGKKESTTKSVRCEGADSEFKVHVLVEADRDGNYSVVLNKTEKSFDFIMPPEGRDYYPMYTNESIDFEFDMKGNKSVKKGIHVLRYTVLRDGKAIEQGEIKVEVGEERKEDKTPAFESALLIAVIIAIAGVKRVKQ